MNRTALAFLPILLLAAVSAGAAQKRSREQMDIDKALEAVDDCLHWGGDAENDESMKVDCAEAELALKNTSHAHPKNPALLEPINSMVQTALLDRTEPFIAEYCAALAGTFEKNPAAEGAEAFDKLCRRKGAP